MLFFLFQYNPILQHLAMAGNAISEMTPGSLPPLVKHLHVGRNHLNSLNHTLRYNPFPADKKEEYMNARKYNSIVY